MSIKAAGTTEPAGSTWRPMAVPAPDQVEAIGAKYGMTVLGPPMFD